jgi:hypothetical protein
VTPDPNGPEFTARLEGRAYAHFKGPHTPASLSFLCEYLKHEKWLGNLRVHFQNGGITDVVFEEIKKATSI